MKKRFLVMAAFLVAGVALSAGLAMAAPAGKLDSQVIGNVRIDENDPTVGYVTARYICEGGDGAHVWVSAKQAESALPEQWLTEEGSGANSATWSHSHANAATCDGNWHVDTFTINQEEWGWGELDAGAGMGAVLRDSARRGSRERRRDHLEHAVRLDQVGTRRVTQPAWDEGGRRRRHPPSLSFGPSG